MDPFEEILKLLEAKQESENSVTRRGANIKLLWFAVAFMYGTGGMAIFTMAVWYSKMEHVARAVDQIYESYFGIKLP